MNSLEFVNLPITVFGSRSIDHNAVIFRKNCRDTATRTLQLALGASECPQRADSGSHPHYPFNSFCLDAGCFDDRPPFVDFGALKQPKRFRRLLLGRRNLKAHIGKTLAHIRIG